MASYPGGGDSLRRSIGILPLRAGPLPLAPLPLARLCLRLRRRLRE